MIIIPIPLPTGLRALVGLRNLGIIQDQVRSVVTVSDARIVDAMELAWAGLKQLVEPSGAVALAAVMDRADAWRGKRVGVISVGRQPGHHTTAGSLAMKLWILRHARAEGHSPTGRDRDRALSSRGIMACGYLNQWLQNSGLIPAGDCTGFAGTADAPDR